MNYIVDIRDFKEKNIYSLKKEFSGTNREGEKLSFTNYYMCRNDKPYFGISGEFHFSRMEDNCWEDELIKMKMCGINTISTYVFWNHHEEEEGVWDFTGRRNLRKFILLCKKHDLFVILRVGPFAHGEARNGGMPDWLYGKPFEVRQLNDGFLYYTRGLYTRIAKEAKGLFYQDNGPVIAVQIDNEYMHSSAPWEMTHGISNEWVFGGNEKDAYMLHLKALATECGLTPVFYTCTGWGGARTPESMMPLWGGYAYRPWLIYDSRKEHPCTEEYIYQDFHRNGVVTTNDFRPRYQPEEKPYACCEMGGGMMCTYNYRFILPYKSIDAMANIKLASGCNFLGYYVFQGGSHPVGKNGTFMNEGQVAKISYDYQAPLGEFGQIRESYQRLKAIHFFVRTFAERICGLKTILPEGASDIAPTDMQTLRYAVRTDGHRGFLFINNFQDHAKMPAHQGENVTVLLKDEKITFENLSIAGEENCILPFHFDMDGIELIQATAQAVTYLKTAGETTYVFLRPTGMQAKFVFAEGVQINGVKNAVFIMDNQADWAEFTVEKEQKKVKVLCVDREIANLLYIWEGKGLLFTKAALLIEGNKLRLESMEACAQILTYPANLLADSTEVKKQSVPEILGGKVGCYERKVSKVDIPAELQQVGNTRYTITFSKNFMQKAKTPLKEVLLKIYYKGDIGQAFIDGKMVHDNFCNGAPWEIGLSALSYALEEHSLTIYITPKKEVMTAGFEVVDNAVGEIERVEVVPVYEIPV